MSDGGGLGELAYLEIVGGPLDGQTLVDEGQDLVALQVEEISRLLEATVQKPIRWDSAWGLFERCDANHLHWCGWFNEAQLPSGWEERRPDD